jgi:hypothetical protein
VRIAESTNIFTKGSKPKWSKEVYKIASKEGYSFRIQDKKGKPLPKPFRAWELLPVQEDEEEEEESEEEEEVQEEPEPEPAVPERKSTRVRRAPVLLEEEPSPAKRTRRARTEYVVESILDHRRVKKKLEFLTKYKDYATPSWQALENFYIPMPTGERILNIFVKDYAKAIV